MTWLIKDSRGLTSVRLFTQYCQRCMTETTIPFSVSQLMSVPVYHHTLTSSTAAFIVISTTHLLSFRTASVEMWARGSKVRGSRPPALWLPSLKLHPSRISPHVWPQPHTCKVSSPRLERLRYRRADKICPRTNRQTPGKSTQNPFCVGSRCEMCPQEPILP